MTSFRILFFLFLVANINPLSLYASRDHNIDSLLLIWNEEDNTNTKEKFDAIKTLFIDSQIVEQDLERARVLSEEHIIFAQKYGTKENKIEACTYNAKILNKQGESQEALTRINACIEQGLEDIPEELKNKTLLTKTQIILFSGGGSEALDILYELLESKKLAEQERYEVHKFLSIIYARLGKFSKAFLHLDESFKYIDNLEYPNYKKSVYYNNKSTIYYRMGDIKSAIDNNIKAQNRLSEVDPEIRNFNAVRGSVLNYKYNLASMYEQIEKLEMAKAIANETLNLIEVDEYDIKKYLYILCATIYTKQDSLAKADQYLVELKTSIENVSDKACVADYYVTLGLLELAKGEYDAANNACTEGFAYYNEIKNLLGIKRCAECLHEVNSKLENSVEALHFYKIAKTASDSLKQIEHINKIAQLESRREFEEEILLLEEKAKAERKNKLIFLIIIITTLLLTLALLRIYYIENKKRSLLESQNKLLEENLANKVLLEKQAKVLDKQKKQKAEFLTNIAHELHTPLMIIGGQSNNLLSSSEISQQNKKTISSIVRNSKNLTKLTKEIIETTRNDDWQLEPLIKSFYFYEIINPTITENELIAKSKNLKLKFNLNNTQDVLLVTDPDKLVVVINNLLSNAIRYSNDGDEIIINCEADEDNLYVTIKDHGIGIPEEDLPKIFQRFYQVHDSSKDKNPYGGFGIGLAICKEYIELLKGSINVESAVNKGTSFQIKIPKVLDPESENQPSFESQQSQINLPQIPNKIFVSDTKPYILIVEDNTDIWLYYQNILGENYNLDFTANGKEALAFLKSNKAPNLIVTDVMMPIMDGMKLIEILKSNNQFDFIPILVVTARFDIQEKILGLSLNLDDYIIKPFDDRLFLARINYLIDLSKDHFREIIIHKKANSSFEPKDKKWLSEVESIVRESLGDVNLSPLSIAEKMNLSQVHMDRKLKALIGFTTSKYILEARLRVALEIIEKKEASMVKEVCYKVGYKSPRTFTKSFKQRFGVYPSEMLDK